MISKLNIQPVVKIQNPKIAVSISIEILSIDLNTSANIKVLFYDDIGHIIDDKLLLLEQPEYTNWGSDDTFIISWVCEKLNIKTIL